MSTKTEYDNHFIRYFPTIVEIGEPKIRFNEWEDFVDQLGTTPLNSGDVKLISHGAGHICLVGTGWNGDTQGKPCTNLVFVNDNEGFRLSTGPEPAWKAWNTICMDIDSEGVFSPEVEDRIFLTFCKWMSNQLSDVAKLLKPKTAD